MRNFLAGLSKHALYVSTRTNWEKNKFSLDFSSLLFLEGKIIWGILTNVSCMFANMHSSHRGEPFMVKSFSKKVLFALNSSDFEKNCFWLLVEKFRHKRQNCTPVYVARFQRKQLFLKYSTLHIDDGLWLVFLCFRWQLLGRGVEFAINVPEKQFCDRNLIWEQFQLESQFQSLSEKFTDFLATYFLRASWIFFLHIQSIVLRQEMF